MLPEQYPEIKSWRSNSKDMIPYFHLIDIPWDEYGGNGNDYFEIKKRVAEQISQPASRN
jgi:hypothetical protein